MKGQLSEHPLAELAREVSIAGLSGALRLEHGAARAVIYFEDGEVAYAASNLRAFRLAECLRRWHVVSEQQLADAGQHASDMKLAYALSANGALSRQAIGELFARQAAEVLHPALLWIEGDWSFDPRVRLAEEIKARIPLTQLLMESARRLPPDYTVTRFKEGDELISPAEGGVPENVALQPVEAFILSRVDAPLRVSELTAISGLPEAQTLGALYALTLGGFLQRSNWPRGFKDEQIRWLLAIKAQAAAKGAAETAKDEKAGEAAQATNAAVEVKAERDEQQELEELFARLEGAASYYEVLGVGRSAELAEIKRVYHTLARRFHPDKFQQNEELRPRIEDAFARIAKAYETLKDKRSRATYDYKLDDPRR